MKIYQVNYIIILGTSMIYIPPKRYRRPSGRKPRTGRPKSGKRGGGVVVVSFKS